MGKSRKNPVSDAQITAAYARLGSANLAADELGIGRNTAYRVLLKLGIELNGVREYRRRVTKFLGKEHEIREAYEAGGTMKQLSEQFGVATHYAIKNAIRRAGGTIRQNPIPTILPGELEKIRELHESGLGQMPISVRLGRSQSFVSRVMRNNGIAPHKSAPHKWRGNRRHWKHADGYLYVWVSADDPFAAMRTAAGYILEHRLVMARALGRPLTQNETVHHINGDKSDNRIDNLQLRHGKHGKHEALCCLNCGSRNIGAVPLE